ncbi:Sema-1a, partial [Trichostrongylus colubriformis]
MANSDQKISCSVGVDQYVSCTRAFTLADIYETYCIEHFRNAVYNLSLTTLSVHHKIDWKPPADVIEECLMKGKLKSDCQNYIRVLARQSSGKALICGTHAFSPKCREYVYSSTDGTLKNVR